MQNIQQRVRSHESKCNKVHGPCFMHNKVHKKYCQNILYQLLFNNNKVRVIESELNVYKQMAYSFVDLIQIEPRLHYQLLTSSSDQAPSSELLILETQIQTSEGMNGKLYPS